MMRAMPPFPLHELERSDILPFVIHHYSTLYFDDADVQIRDDYTIRIGDSSIRLGQECVAMCAPARWLVTFSRNRTVDECIQVRHDERSVDAYGLTGLECRPGDDGHMLTVRLYDENFDDATAKIMQLCDGLINTMKHRMWAWRDYVQAHDDRR
jgi:hypothetical protein